MPRILVVDDEEIVLHAVKDFLELKGFHVQTAENGENALQRIDENEIDLVLSDIKMPGMSGIELLGNIHRQKPELGVIMMTGYTDTTAAVDAMKIGAFDYISKPFNFDELLISIGRALEKTKLVRLNREYQNTLEQKVMEQSRLITKMYTETVTSLTIAIEAKDEYTKGHSLRVTDYVRLLTDKVGFDYELKNKAITAAQLHDIGKLGIADNILNKPGKLSDEEFDLVRQHPLTSEKILMPILDETTILFVRHHHERWDGKGYPDGLSGQSIPIGARLIALGDTFDAMTSKRAYRDALDLAWAFEEIERCSGSQFDPDFVPAFLEIAREFCDGQK